MKGAGIILLILGGMLLAGIFLPMLTAPRIDAKKAITRHEMSVLKTALSSHVQEYGKLPGESADASVLDILTGKNPLKISFYSAPRIKSAIINSWMLGTVLLFSKETPATWSSAPPAKTVFTTPKTT